MLFFLTLNLKMFWREINNEILKSFVPNKEDEKAEDFDQEAFEAKIKEELIAEFTKSLNERMRL
jgi:hypothetical protein